MIQFEKYLDIGTNVDEALLWVLWRHAVMLHSAVQTVTLANCSHSQSTIVNTTLIRAPAAMCNVPHLSSFCRSFIVWLITPSCGATGAGSAHAPVSLPSSASAIQVLLWLSANLLPLPPPFPTPAQEIWLTWLPNYPHCIIHLILH